MNEKVYAALSKNEVIKAACGTRIDHNGTPDGGTYPALYYGEISNVPALMADNMEKFTRLTIQVSILNDTGAFGELPKAVETVMLGLGFIKFSYNDLNWIDNGSRIYCKAMRYTIGGVNE